MHDKIVKSKIYYIHYKNIFHAKTANGNLNKKYV